ncbi:hypothetical protein LSG31_16345 [Fodinisporobacter ferrooxydans]|uniref:Uncharacterized protein n=1 Tax=Fodinisporobacter ferrooxydans TaxID=2901836 RepID=A0ABY4CJV6_9BACL|nr:hypothetical protein LSG31_16345 [Alicyclobacillaceae bacterium MYW30-H2]
MLHFSLLKANGISKGEAVLSQIFGLLKDYWVLVAICLILLFVLRIFFRAIFRIAVIAAIVCFVLVFFFHVPPAKITQWGKQVSSTVDDSLKQSIQAAIQKEWKEAKYTFHPDGSYEIQTTHLKIIGKKGDPTATVYFNGHKVEININDLGEQVKRDIEQQQLGH